MSRLSRCYGWRARCSYCITDLVTRNQIYVDRSLEISCEACTNTALLGGGVDTDEDEVGLHDSLVDFSGEEQVATATFADDVFETRLVDGELEILVVPCIDTSLVEINDRDNDMGALQRNNGASRTAWSTYKLIYARDLDKNNLPT